MSVTVITGAGGGMGQACVRALRDTGPLLLVDLDNGRLAEALTNAPQSATLVTDVSTPSDIETLAERVASLGGLAALVHLAGVSPTMADVTSVLEVDLVGTALLTQALLRHAVPGSVAVCVASIAAHMSSFTETVDEVLDDPLLPDLPGRLESALGVPLTTGSAYMLAKRGVVRLCEREAVAWGKRGARILSLSPGLIDTPMGRLELRENPAKASLIGLTPVDRPADEGSAELPGRVDDIAQGIAYLCSSAASFVSGCDLRVDGGLVAALRFPHE